MLKKITFIAFISFAYSASSFALFWSTPSKEHCSQKLVALIETKQDTKKIQELFTQCIKHGNSEEQMNAAIALKPEIEENGLKTLSQINRDVKNKTTEVKQANNWRWYHYFGCIWLALGICVAAPTIAENEVDNYYRDQPEPIDEQDEENNQTSQKKKKSKDQQKKRLVN